MQAESQDKQCCRSSYAVKQESPLPVSDMLIFDLQRWPGSMLMDNLCVSDATP